MVNIRGFFLLPRGGAQHAAVHDMVSGHRLGHCSERAPQDQYGSRITHYRTATERCQVPGILIKIDKGITAAAASRRFYFVDTNRSFLILFVRAQLKWDYKYMNKKSMQC